MNFGTAVLNLAILRTMAILTSTGEPSNVFSFGSPFQISSVPEDGSQPLEVYMTSEPLAE